MKQLGNRLRTLREGLGISQAKFAEIIGSTQSSINRYENGQATPTVELLRKYADYFDVSMDYISLAAMSRKASCIKQSLRWKITRNSQSLWRCALIRNRPCTTD